MLLSLGPARGSHVHTRERARGCRNGANRMNMRNDGGGEGEQGNGKRPADEEGAERGKFLCGPVSLPLSLCSSPFDSPFSLLPLLLPALPVPDLNIKGGLNLTYTTLNHVTSTGL